MTDILALSAELREQTGTGPARELRRKGLVPAIIYGKDKQPISIAIAEKEITKYYRKPQFISQVIQLEIDGKKSHKVLPKKVELNPVNDIVRHVDFVFLESKMQKMAVPIVYDNKENCIGVKRGGYFNTVRRVLNILCPVDSLPRKLVVDTTDLPVGTSIKASDIELPEGAELLDRQDFVIASIIGKKGKSTEVDDNPAEASAEGGEEATKEGQ